MNTICQATQFPIVDPVERTVMMTARSAHCVLSRERASLGAARLHADATLLDRALLPRRSQERVGQGAVEVRGWTAWHHHMTLVCLALLFMLQERCKARTHTPLLSARDIVELLAYYLPAGPAAKPKCCDKCGTATRRVNATWTIGVAASAATTAKIQFEFNKIELVGV